MIYMQTLQTSIYNHIKEKIENKLIIVKIDDHNKTYVFASKGTQYKLKYSARQSFLFCSNGALKE